MKKVLFIASAVLGLASLDAQEKTTSSQIGIKSFANMSSFNGKDVRSSADYAIGFAAGLYGHFPITSSFAVQPEVNFARIGGIERKVKNSTENFRANTTRTLDYIQVPLMFKYYFAGSRFNIEAGPQASFNIYASRKNVVNYLGNTVISTETKQDIKDQTKNFDFGFNFGLGYNLTDNINVGARYYMGVTKITENTNDGTETGADIKNHSFSLGVGYSF